MFDEIFDKEDIQFGDKEGNIVTKTLVFFNVPDQLIDFVAMFKGKDLNNLETILSMDEGKGLLKQAVYFTTEEDHVNVKVKIRMMRKLKKQVSNKAFF